MWQFFLDRFSFYKLHSLLKIFLSLFFAKFLLPHTASDMLHMYVSFCYVSMCSYMTQKLFAFAKGKCCAESCDNPMFQEVLLAGHLCQNVLKVLIIIIIILSLIHI